MFLKTLEEEARDNVGASWWGGHRWRQEFDSALNKEVEAVDLREILGSSRD